MSLLEIPPCLVCGQRHHAFVRVHGQRECQLCRQFKGFKIHVPCEVPESLVRLRGSLGTRSQQISERLQQIDAEIGRLTQERDRLRQEKRWLGWGRDVDE